MQISEILLMQSEINYVGEIFSTKMMEIPEFLRIRVLNLYVAKRHNNSRSEFHFAEQNFTYSMNRFHISARKYFTGDLYHPLYKSP